MKIATLATALLSAAPTILGLTTGTANAATLVVEGDGILTGAKGVTIGNRIYDVEFREGTCAQVYGTCTKPSFAFEFMSDAQAAAAVLLDQVFVDGPLGRFDSNPALTFGCADTVCNTLITYGNGGNLSFFAGVVANRDVDQDITMSTARAVQLNSASLPNYNFARFTFVGVVPEPETWATMLVGFGMIGATTRYRRKSRTGSFA